MGEVVAVIGNAGDPLVREAIIRQLGEAEVALIVGSPDQVWGGVDEISEAVLCLDPPEVPGAAAAAASSAVARIVLISSAAAPFERGAPIDQQWFLPAEQAVERSRLEWTIVRPVGLMTAALSWASDVRTTNTVRHPYGDTAYPHVHEADVAAVAVAALTTDGHHRQRYTISGPAAITPIEQTTALSAALGRHLDFEELSPAAAAQRWQQEGWAPDDIDLELMLLADFAHRPPRPRDTVQRVLGRPARPFSEWAVEHADDFR